VAGSTVSAVYRFLLSRQWVILTLLGLLLMPTMYKLGFWQLHRHESKTADNQLTADNLATPPVPVERLTRPGATVPSKDLYRTVTATGRYDTAHEVVARQRTAADDSTIGYHVITPLVMADGRAVLVNRGWIAAGDDLTMFPKIPAAPGGTVTVTGRLRPDETTAVTGIRNKTGLPDRQIMLINSKLLAKDVPERLVGGYMELAGTSPKPTIAQPQLIPKPVPVDTALNMGYAIQWWLFTAMVPVAWVILVRREHREQLLAANKASASADDGRADDGTADEDGTAADDGRPTSTADDEPAPVTAR
jgi:cytochrome oxidase assembly protein ShyY1